MNSDTFFKILSQVEGPVEYLNLILTYPEYLAEGAWRWQQTGYQKFGWTELDFQKIYQQYHQQERDVSGFLFIVKNKHTLSHSETFISQDDLSPRALYLLSQMLPVPEEGTTISFEESKDGYNIIIYGEEDIEEELEGIVNEWGPSQ